MRVLILIGLLLSPNAWGAAGILGGLLSQAPAAAGGGGGGGTPAFVSFQLGEENTIAAQLKVTNTVTAGYLIVVGVGWEDVAATVTATNSVGDTFTTIAVTSGAGPYSALLYASNSVGGTVVTSVTFSSSASYAQIGSWIFSGCSSGAPLDLQKTGSDTGTSVSTATGTTAQAVEALVTVTKNYNALTATEQGSWTEDSDNAGSFGTHFQHFITSTSGTYGGVATLSGSIVWASSFAAFK